MSEPARTSYGNGEARQVARVVGDHLHAIRRHGDRIRVPETGEAVDVDLRLHREDHADLDGALVADIEERGLVDLGGFGVAGVVPLQVRHAEVGVDARDLAIRLRQRVPRLQRVEALCWLVTSTRVIFCTLERGVPSWRAG